MRDFPHLYVVAASSTSAENDVTLDAAGLSAIRSASPAEFDGPGNRWSPETLLVGAVADCYILTFRAVARASNLAWNTLRCEAKGTLDRVDRTTQFTRFDLSVDLGVPAEANRDLARRVLEKAERACLITNSLKASVHLSTNVVAAAEPLRAIEALTRG